MAKRTPKTITIGSGRPYIMAYDGTTIPDKETICKDENLLGYVKGGAALEYTVEPYEEKDDLGLVSKIIVNTEELIFKMGLLAWNGTTLQKLVERCQVVDDNEKGIRTINIGGAGNSQGKNWVLCFHHIDKLDGDIWVIILGANAAGLTLTFAADEGTVLEPEFKALPMDDKGTLAKIIEETGTAQ